MRKRRTDLIDELATGIPIAKLGPEVARILGVPRARADEIVRAFDSFVARPLESNLHKLRGRDLAKRNPMIYTARGTRSAREWAGRVLDDKETSAIESHIGTFMEEVARIVSDGVKPGGGTDLQVETGDGTVRLYAMQSAPNTKNAGSRKSDVEALKRAARPLRAARRHVELYVGVLSGQVTASKVGAEPDIAIPSSDELWEKLSGIADFRARLLRASLVLSQLVRSRASDDVARIVEEAVRLYGDADGELDLEALANPPMADARAHAIPPRVED